MQTQRKEESRGRNTEVVPPIRRRRNWFFTWNNYVDEDIEGILTQNNIKKYCFQEEVGKEGTKHLQGVLVFNNAMSLVNLKNKFGDKPHWEVCRNINAARNYCKKLETHEGRRWEKGFRDNVLKVRDVVADTGYRKWQKEIIDMIEGEPDDRTIHWFWESVGNVGKTMFCKHLVLKYNAIVVGGRSQDAFFCIQERLKKGIEIGIIVFDITRSEYNKVSYKALEGIKSGLFFSSKYEAGMCCFNSPWVIVFSNYEPEKLQLSMDRWCIRKIEF